MVSYIKFDLKAKVMKFVGQKNPGMKQGFEFEI